MAKDNASQGRNGSDKDDDTKSLIAKKLPASLQATLDSDEKMWELDTIEHEPTSTDSNIRYAAYAARARTIMLSAQRYVAYTSDIGESFRPVAHPYLIKGAYGVSWAYLVGDVAYEGRKAYMRNQAVLHPPASSEQQHDSAPAEANKKDGGSSPAPRKDKETNVKMTTAGRTALEKKPTSPEKTQASSSPRSSLPGSTTTTKSQLRQQGNQEKYEPLDQSKAQSQPQSQSQPDQQQPQPGRVPAIEDYRTVAVQRGIFQAIASMGLPAFTIHSIVRYSGRAMKDMKNTKIRTWGPIGLGLAAVPFLPYVFDKPVEEAVEWTFHKSFEMFGGPAAVGGEKKEL